MNSTEAKIIADYLLGNFEYEMQTTLSVLAAVPNDNLSYQPDSLAKSGIGLVRHIVLEDEWLLNSIADGQFNPPPDDSDACGIATPADGVAQYRAKVPIALGRVRAMSTEQLTQVIDLLGVIQLPAVEFIALTLKHSVHHRGQLSSYIRPMGGRVPGIYGPSANTATA
ncbi:MAG: DinB family protein [Bryobacteraceae bacterium]